MSFRDDPPRGVARVGPIPNDGEAPGSGVRGRASVPGQSGNSGRATPVSRPASGRASVSGSASVAGNSAPRAGRASVPGNPYDQPTETRAPRRQRPDEPVARSRSARRAADLPAKKAKKRRRRRRFALVAAVLALAMLVGAGGVGYALVQVPLPDALPTKQASYIYYNDGKTELAKLAVENREDVKLSAVPIEVQHAVVAAEDRTFYSNSGVDVAGIGRAIVGVVTGEDKGGGSTITQQYIRNALDLTRERSYTRKAKEIVLAMKADDKYSKEQILEFYLNTIYYGRGAYGIQAASKAYFGVDVSKLTAEQGAVIASVIKDPTNLDPVNNPEDAKSRWSYILTAMAEEGWYDKAKVEGAQYPKIAPPGTSKNNVGLDGPTGYIVAQVEAEVAKYGITPNQLRTGGYRIITTIDKKMQLSAQKAVTTVMNGQPANLASALVAVEPKTGKVLAYYGGKAGFGQFDYASSAHSPGSSFKAYILAEAIEQGISIKSYWDGSDNQEFPDRPGQPVHNSENNDSCGRCTLTRATVLSLNTTYYALTREVGADKVAELAARAGITTLDGKPVAQVASSVGNRVALGEPTISVVDQATGFATFAANGQYAAPFFVQKVTQGDQSTDYTTPKTGQAFSADVAADATYVMQQVVESGKRRLADGRTAAGKTGTVQYQLTDENAHAWMAGYTPQVAAAVWVGNKGKDAPIRDAEGNYIYGSGVPSTIWRAFMDGALAGAKNMAFPKPVYLGDDKAGNIASPTPKPSPKPTPSKSPKPTPTPSANPTPTESPTPSTGPTKSPKPNKPTDSPTPSFPFSPSPTESRRQPVL